MVDFDHYFEDLDGYKMSAKEESVMKTAFDKMLCLDPSYWNLRPEESEYFYYIFKFGWISSAILSE
jgi:hypothetical protein